MRRWRPAARLSGRGTLRFLAAIYDALLWQRMPSTAATTLMRAKPLALELRYARSLYGSLIAERSLREMERAGLIPSAQSERWLAFMRDAFPMLLLVIASPVCGTRRRRRRSS